MDKLISYDTFMSVKRVAQACNPLYTKRERVKKQIEKLASEYRDYDNQISCLEAGIKQVTGFRVEDLVQKAILPMLNSDGTPKVDHEGKQLKVTKYLPTSRVSYNKETHQYVVSVSEEPQSEPVETQASTILAPSYDVFASSEDL